MPLSGLLGLPPTPGLTRDQAIALLDAADADTGPQVARTAALVSALLYTGARVSGLLGADIEDLGTDRGHRVLRVRRKGGKIQALALPAPAAARIDAYLAGRNDVTALPAIPGGTAAAARRRVLFATGTGARMYRAEVRTMLRRLGRAAGLPAGLAASLSPHSMRHVLSAFATLNLDAGASLRDLQDAMGHASPHTSRRYDRSRGNLDSNPGPVETGALLGPQALPAAAELAEDPGTPPAPPARRSPGTEPRPDQPGQTSCRALPAP